MAITFTAQIQRSTPTGDDVLWTATAGDTRLAGTITKPQRPAEALCQAIALLATPEAVTIEMSVRDYVRLARVPLATVNQDCTTGKLTARRSESGGWVITL